MKTATLERVKAMSIVRRDIPGTRTLRRYRWPAAWSSFRTATSGAVSRLACRLILAETAGEDGFAVFMDVSHAQMSW
ncbi:hypothetical protein GCM10010372_47360 [Streptomyces tauricus]|nr:hypothetical protein GCM10010372_47360 [Streptomyces tauricus]